MNLHYVQGKPLFANINKTIRQYEYLTEDMKTDVIIIGAGVTGSILGYYFSKAGIPSIILEKERVAYGSTSITTSLLQYELDSNAKVVEEYTSLENIIKSYKLGLKALKEIDEFIKEHGNKCSYEQKDTLLYTSKKIEFSEIEQEYLLRKQAGLDVDFISEKNNQFSFDLKAGIYAKKGGAQLDSYLFTHHLLEVSCNMGLKVYENTEVTHINYKADNVEVITNYGYKILGKKVIVATGYNTDKFTNRQYGQKTVTYNIATKPVESFDGWYNKVLIRDNNDPYYYFRTTEQNRIIAGGEDIPFIPGIYDENQANKKYELLLQRIKNMFPNINNIEIDYAYCGAFASTQDNLGFIGPDPKQKNLWLCLGYGANGILFAVLGGLMLSELYKNNVNENLKLFRLNRFSQR